MSGNRAVVEYAEGVVLNARPSVFEAFVQAVAVQENELRAKERVDWGAKAGQVAALFSERAIFSGAFVKGPPVESRQEIAEYYAEYFKAYADVSLRLFGLRVSHLHPQLFMGSAVSRRYKVLYDSGAIKQYSSLQTVTAHLTLVTNKAGDQIDHYDAVLTDSKETFDLQEIAAERKALGPN